MCRVFQTYLLHCTVHESGNMLGRRIWLCYLLEGTCCGIVYILVYNILRKNGDIYVYIYIWGHCRVTGLGGVGRRGICGGAGASAVGRNHKKFGFLFFVARLELAASGPV